MLQHRSQKQLKTQASWRPNRASACLIPPLKKGGIHICPYLSSACCCVDMYARFRNAWGPHKQETHVFSWQGWAEWTEPSSCTKERNWCVVVALPVRAQQGQWKYRSTGFSFVRGKESFQGTCPLNGECVNAGLCYKSQILRGSLCSNEQRAERIMMPCVGVRISSTFLGTLCVRVCGCQRSCWASSLIYQNTALFSISSVDHRGWFTGELADRVGHKNVTCA